VSNVGRWTPWYAGATEQTAYADTATYAMAAEFLDGLAVEDWGCGLGWFARYHRGPYLGVDGTASPWCDEVDDLVTRRSDTPGLLLRHVLEHNVDWRAVLGNAVASATKRLVIVTFIPSGDGEQVGFTPELGVPDIAVPHAAIDEALAGHRVDRCTLATATYYGTETIWRAEVPCPSGS